MRETYAKHEENEHFGLHMLTQGSSGLQQASSLLSGALPEHTFGPPGLFQAHLWTARAPPDHKTLVKHVFLASRPQNTRKTRAFGASRRHSTHKLQQNTHTKYVLVVLSPMLIYGFRWVHRAHFLVRQGEKAIASTLQTAKHS